MSDYSLCLCPVGGRRRGCGVVAVVPGRGVVVTHLCFGMDCRLGGNVSFLLSLHTPLDIARSSHPNQLTAIHDPQSKVHGNSRSSLALPSSPTPSPAPVAQSSRHSPTPHSSGHDLLKVPLLSLRRDASR